MGELSRYIIGVLIVAMLISVFYFSLYSESTATDKTNISSSSNISANILNLSQSLGSTLQTDVTADPNNPVDIAGFFGKTLAVGGKVIALVFASMVASVDFITVILGNLATLPAPFNIIGLFIPIGIAILFITLAFVALKAFIGRDW